ncbi:MAG: hypothetical protein V1685_03025 [Parcubacteria group bacterium]
MYIKQVTLSIALFLGVYIVPMLIATARGVHGIVLLAIAACVFVVQVAFTVRFYKKRQPVAGFVGIVVLMAQVVLYIVNNITYVRTLISR